MLRLKLVPAIEDGKWRREAEEKHAVLTDKRGENSTTRRNAVQSSIEVETWSDGTLDDLARASAAAEEDKNMFIVFVLVVAAVFSMRREGGWWRWLGRTKVQCVRFSLLLGFAVPRLAMPYHFALLATTIASSSLPKKRVAVYFLQKRSQACALHAHAASNTWIIHDLAPNFLPFSTTLCCLLR